MQNELSGYTNRIKEFITNTWNTSGQRPIYIVNLFLFLAYLDAYNTRSEIMHS